MKQLLVRISIQSFRLQDYFTGLSGLGRNRCEQSKAFKKNEIDNSFIDLGYVDVIGKKPPMKYMIWYQNLIDNFLEVISYPFNRRE